MLSYMAASRGWAPAGDGSQARSAPLPPQVSALVQTLRAPDGPFLQPRRWLGSWVRQVWGSRGPRAGGWQWSREGLHHDIGALGPISPASRG